MERLRVRGAEDLVATLDVYVRAPAAGRRPPPVSVARCRAIRIVRSETRTWLDSSGTRTIEIAATMEPVESGGRQ